jgi:peptidoglycan/xylan/chitin deacetylase (PgdA/CDA1 family)
MDQAGQPLTVVMYHYVRPLAAGRYPRLKGLEPADFRRQLDYLAGRYAPVGMDDVLAAGRGERPLPADAVLLTFDDGFSDHYAYVFPELWRRGIPGAFFPSAAAVLDRRLYDVHKLHLILAACDDATAPAGEVDRAVDEQRAAFGLDTVADYRARYAVASRLDTAEVMYVKRMVQTVLPPPLRAAVADRLFRRFAGVEEAVAAQELYLTVDQLRVMIANGMHVGLHGDAHDRLGHLPAAAQADDIARSLRLLSALGLPTTDFSFCYPYGSYNSDTPAILQRLGCACAFTTVPEIARVLPSGMLTLARLDTRDLPGGGALIGSPPTTFPVRRKA